MRAFSKIEISLLLVDALTMTIYIIYQLEAGNEEKSSPTFEL